MAEPLSYKELEQLVQNLKAENKKTLNDLDRVEKQCQSKEDFYQQIINLTNEGMIIVNGDKIRYINQTALFLLDSSRNEIEKLSLSDLIHNNSKGLVIQKISDIISNKIKHSEVETDIITPSRKIINAKIIIERLNNSFNQNLLLIKIENIQNLKEKENEVKNLQSAFDLLDQLVSEGVLIISQPQNKERALFSWIIEDLNKASVSYFGKKRSEIIGDVWGNYFIPEFEYELPQTFDSEFSDEFELYITNIKKHLRFTIKWLDYNKLSCRFVDITDVNNLKRQLNTDLQRNELIVEILNVFNTNDSFDTKINSILEKVAYHFKTRRILVTKHETTPPIAEIVAQNSKEKLEKFTDDFHIPLKRVPSYLKMLEERKMILGFSLKYLPEDLQDFFKGIQFSSVYIFPIVIDKHIHGSVLFECAEDEEIDNTGINFLKIISVLISSLIDRYLTEEKILNAKNSAEEADRLKSSFLVNMSHDIRIPMTAIIGFSDLLADPDLTMSEREEFIELISKSGQDLLTLVDNIIDVAKIETGQLRIQKDKTSLEHLCKDLFSTHVKNEKIFIQDDLELMLDFNEKYFNLPFETDVFRFKQVFNNLIDNAIKFTDSGIIRFGISNVWDNTIEFYVQDTGIGIAEETQHIIFKRFGKIDQSYTKEYKGTGLGLSLSKSIVKLMKGDIRVQSYTGKGSTFYFTHPLPENALESISKKEKASEKIIYHWNNKNILIVEDVEQNYKYLEFMLHPTKANVIWAKNGQEAIDYFANKNSADVVLMDIRMPVVNGIEATKEILKSVTIPIIAQTAYTFGDEKHLAMQAGCVSYLSKPINSNDLLPLLDGYLNKNQKFEE